MKKETFCRYIRQYETDMFRFAKSIVGTQADGEDAMQESILKAYENIDTELNICIDSDDYITFKKKIQSMDLSDPGK